MKESRWLRATRSIPIARQMRALTGSPPACSTPTMDLEEERIAVLIPAGLDYVTALHGIWRAGEHRDSA